jgi:hypothetical protein
MTVCMKCGSVLAAEATIHLAPPRAGWTKPFRSVGYRINRWFGFSLPTRFREVLGHVLPKEFLESYSPFHMVLSVIPGLGHLVLGELLLVRFVLTGWLAAMLAGLFFYGSLTGGFLLGLGIALHAWMIADSGKMWELFTRIQTRLLFSVLVVFLLVMGVYNPIRNLAGGYVRGVIPGVPVPTDGIEGTDFILINLHAYDREPPLRGDVVLTNLPRGPLLPNHLIQLVGGEVLAKVIGIPGDRIEIKGGQVSCIRENKVFGTYPVPDDLMKKIEGVVEVPENTYYGLVKINLVGHGIPPEQQLPMARDLLLKAGLFDRGSIRGRAFMIYNPLRRRGFLPHPNPADTNAVTQ